MLDVAPSIYKSWHACAGTCSTCDIYIGQLHSLIRGAPFRPYASRYRGGAAPVTMSRCCSRYCCCQPLASQCKVLQENEQRHIQSCVDDHVANKLGVTCSHTPNV